MKDGQGVKKKLLHIQNKRKNKDNCEHQCKTRFHVGWVEKEVLDCCEVYLVFPLKICILYNCYASGQFMYMCIMFGSLIVSSKICDKAVQTSAKK